MSFWEVEHLRKVVGGTWLSRGTGPAAAAPSGVSIDSRTIRAGEVFIAIRGDRTDGHLYLEQAAGAGAALAIVDNRAAATPALAARIPMLLVPDAGRALTRLASAYRRTLERTKVVAVTGSNGKTTTTRLIDAVLSRSLTGSASPKSFNNNVGVPLTILGASRTDQYLVCEVGSNHKGEIDELGAIVQPDIAVITSIGRAHSEGLGTLVEVAWEKARLIHHLRPGGVGVVTADTVHLDEPLKGRNLIRFGFSERADVRVAEVRAVEGGTESTLNDGRSYRIPLIGRHNASNAAAAVVVARRLGVLEEKIAEGLAAAKGAEMRLQVRRIAGVTVLDDAYNANPDSMLAGLRTLAEMPASRRVVVLGDMLEMGDGSAGVHAEIGRAIAELGFDAAVLVGEAMEHAAAALREISFAGPVVRLPNADGRHADEAADALRPGDVVLLKGSRRMGLERVVEALERRAGPIGMIDPKPGVAARRRA